ncbi:MAG: NusA-like transcription termination signal-binding factor [Candidatus Aenigmatarchaeota archaeon]|nr:MAG: NusA-like transcription termination signal-binding factor [Candidatus Aenigmarchaeota archaeon]
MTIKLTTEHVRVVGVFERLTRVHARDCLINEDTVYFLIEPGKTGMVIGKNGSKIKNVCKAFGKRVKIFEYADTPEKLTRNLIQNINSIEIHDGVVTVYIPASDKSTVIGKNGRNIKMIREFLNRHFNIKNLRLK